MILCFLSFTFLLLTHSSKFNFDFQSNSLTLPTCSLNGVQTVHLPSSSSSTKSSPNLRLFFTPSLTPIHLDAFDSSDSRVARLELNFLLGHVQINWNGLQSSWYPTKTDNYLELLSASSSSPAFKLNGKTVSVSIPEPSTQVTSYKVSYDDSATPDSDFLDLLEDAELIDSLEMVPIWQSPIESIEVHDGYEHERTTGSKSSIEYLVYDTQSINRLQVAINTPLPKLRSKHTGTWRMLSRRIKVIFSRSKPSPSHLPTLHKQPQYSNNQIFGTVAISAFILYLGLLLKLSQMTSVRPKPVVKEQTVTPATNEHLQQHPQKQQSHSTITKSSASQLNLEFTEAPHLKSTFSASKSVLKVTIPAAFSLADNRHILFPSKLRDFQK